jgi:hypothetical protein
VDILKMTGFRSLKLCRDRDLIGGKRAVTNLMEEVISGAKKVMRRYVVPLFLSQFLVAAIACATFIELYFGWW